ncbi:MAG: hypothetical protein CBB87_00520 [Micavibrio sp. TMED27]|nr:hypothetical protein [Micavibrio sp.]OUT92958.1 MAG: hypothetical protein CBB87_00520 [Micavibrio sp. TMED27]|tara:strand:- start:9315 stop:9638 length:324 start_codon:yes stop_codon:yes gene_type:complete
MNDSDNDKKIEQILRARYGVKPELAPALIERMVGAAATAQSQDGIANDAWRPAQRMAAMACLLLSVLAGTVTGFQSPAPTLAMTPEDAVYQQVETVLFAQNFQMSGG